VGKLKEGKGGKKRMEKLKRNVKSGKGVFLVRAGAGSLKKSTATVKAVTYKKK
jgi:hypothetical protein